MASAGSLWTRVRLAIQWEADVGRVTWLDLSCFVAEVRNLLFLPSGCNFLPNYCHIRNSFLELD